MTSYLFAVANYKPTECITGVWYIGFNGTEADLARLFMARFGPFRDRFPVTPLPLQNSSRQRLSCCRVPTRK